MTTSFAERNNPPHSPRDSNEKDILTLEGYKSLFENCEDTSGAFSCYEKLFKMYHPNDWEKKLNSWGLKNSIDCLFGLCTSLFKDKSLEYNDYVTLIQLYSLLENVFRNVLLRPYIPAYRTINKDCGRYRSFIRPYESMIRFTELHFQSNGSNLLTYTELNQTKTIVAALTCSIICYYYIQRLEKFGKDSNRRQ